MVMIDWLLQAGFRIRADDVTVAVDPYLSDVCRDVHGLSRRAPAPLAAAQLDADVVCVSHWHEDHLDLPTVLTALSLGALLVAPPSCVARVRGVLHQWPDIDPERLRAVTAGQVVTLEHGSITAVPARHVVAGFLTEDAVGYVIEVDGVRVYHCGDTEYDRALLAAARQPLDVALLCINGTGGNMNDVEAAALAAQLRPKTVVPMHIGLWTDDGYGPAATLDPTRFVSFCASLIPGTIVHLPEVGQPLQVLAG